MKLEMICRRPEGAARATPLLFVHGSYSGAWVWERHFLPFFAEHGYESHALSLRGHGGSEGRAGLPYCRLGDYVTDVERAVEALGRPPALIGHSLGGMVVQKVLHRRDTPASVLMASVPPHGLLGSLLGVAVTNPLLYQEMAWMQTLGPAVAGQGVLRAALFSEGTPDDVVHDCMARFQPESLHVAYDLLGLDLPPSLPTLDVPVMVVGAGRDGFVFPGAIEATARTYRTTPVVFPEAAHAMMLGKGWEDVATRMLRWLDHTLAT